jgi:hypothetical protein
MDLAPIRTHVESRLHSEHLFEGRDSFFLADECLEEAFNIMRLILAILPCGALRIGVAQGTTSHQDDGFFTSVVVIVAAIIVAVWLAREDIAQPASSLLASEEVKCQRRELAGQDRHQAYRVVA